MANNNTTCERKFIVYRPGLIDFANHHILTMIYITQTFLVNNKGDCHVRLETCNNQKKYFYCRKSCDREKGFRLILEDKEISQEEYNKLIKTKAHKTTKVIHKIRFRFEYREQIFNLDFLSDEVKNPLYNPDLTSEDYNVAEYLLDKTKAIIMIELLNPEEFVEIPRELIVVKEITNELSYTTKSLAKLLKKQGSEA